VYIYVHTSTSTAHTTHHCTHTWLPLLHTHMTAQCCKRTWLHITVDNCTHTMTTHYHTHNDYTLPHTQWPHVPCTPRLIANFVNILLHTWYFTTYAQCPHMLQLPRMILRTYYYTHGTLLHTQMKTHTAVAQTNRHFCEHIANILLHTRHITTHTHDCTYRSCPDW